MATSTYQTFLMLGTTSNNTTTWGKLVDIKDYPDMGSAPEQLETTTLSDPMETYIPGIKKNEQKEFTCNYSKSKYTEIKALEGTEQDLAIWFGGTESGGVVTPTGTDGKFTFKGYVSVYAKGGDVNSVRDMSVVVTPSTAIVVS